MEWHWNGYELTDDRNRMDTTAVLALLGDTYWAADRPAEVQLRAFENSVCFSAFHGGRQIGFARAISDHATFAWIADVIVATDHRGRGVGPWMIRSLLEHPALQTRSQWLATRDAQTLYERFGFERFEGMRRGPAIPGMKPAGATPAAE